MILTNPRERMRFLRFLVVGVFGTLTDFGVFNLLNHLFAVPVVTAGTISFLAGVTNNFLWNRYWVYPDSRSKRVLHQFTQFSVINAIGLLIRVPILAFVTPHVVRFFNSLGSYPAGMKAETMGNNFTLAIAIGIVMFWNFFANRYWTYADVQ